MANGFMMYMDETGRTAAGRQIQVITDDEASAPPTGLDRAKKLVEQDKVDVLAGVLLTPTTYAVVDYLGKAAPRKVVFVGTNASANDMDTTRKSDYFVRTSSSNAQTTVPMGPYVFNDLKIRNVYVTYSDFAAGTEKINPFVNGFKRAGGSIVGEARPPLGASDFSPYLSRISSSNAQATFNFESGADAVAFVKQYAQFGLAPKIKLLGTGDLVDDSVLPAQAQAAVGAITSMHYYSTLDSPENKKFTADFKAKYNAVPSTWAVQGYDGARLIVDALNQTSGATDPPVLMRVMLGAKWNSPRGPVSMSPQYHDIVQNIYVAETRLVNSNVTNVVVKTFEAVSPVE